MVIIKKLVKKFFAGSSTKVRNSYFLRKNTCSNSHRKWQPQKASTFNNQWVLVRYTKVSKAFFRKDSLELGLSWSFLIWHFYFSFLVKSLDTLNFFSVVIMLFRPSKNIISKWKCYLWKHDFGLYINILQTIFGRCIAFY